ncbi:MAG: outer membrane beta-barrel protein [Xanthobacteraceae bacterium]|jgi:outer membrane immunogenic protein
MRRLQCALLATVAVIGTASIAAAADLPVKGPALKPLPVPYNWTGFYLGFQGGGSAWGTAKESYGLPGPGGAGPPFFVGNQSYNMGGPAAGGVVGYDYQFGRTVVGIEGEWNWANINGTSGVFNDLGALPGLSDTVLTRIDSYATVRGRVGYAFGAWNETLVYVDGGGVWGRVTDKYTNPTGLLAPNLTAATNNTASATESGFVVGVGVEYALYWGAHPTNFTVKAEYNYISMAAPTIVYNAAPGNRSTFSDTSLNTFQLGVNYRFNWGG